MPTLAQRKWATWRGKQRLDATTPERLEDVLSECVAFADPVLDASAAAQVWNPVARSWTSRNLP